MYRIMPSYFNDFKLIIQITIFSFKLINIIIIKKKKNKIFKISFERNRIKYLKLDFKEKS